MAKKSKIKIESNTAELILSYAPDKKIVDQLAALLGFFLEGYKLSDLQFNLKI